MNIPINYYKHASNLTFYNTYILNFLNHTLNPSYTTHIKNIEYKKVIIDSKLAPIKSVDVSVNFIFSFVYLSLIPIFIEVISIPKYSNTDPYKIMKIFYKNSSKK